MQYIFIETSDENEGRMKVLFSYDFKTEEVPIVKIVDVEVITTNHRAVLNDNNSEFFISFLYDEDNKEVINIISASNTDNYTFYRFGSPNFLLEFETETYDKIKSISIPPWEAIKTNLIDVKIFDEDDFEQALLLYEMR